ncbi:hypothetical protein AB0M47_10580 [Hamadaea sp. NPDC051192]|uniref:hypothetical protein n=1 Tax=Hamadaea sp. NPDC051192 TaxID=3154940 RepID=UPI003437154E
MSSDSVPVRAVWPAAGIPLAAWLPTMFLCVLLAHGLQTEYVPIEAATVGLWAAGMALTGLLAVWLRRRPHPVLAVVALIAGALVSIDLAVILDSHLIYGVYHYWTLNYDVALPYAYSPMWFPASLIPVDSFGFATQAQITAGDFEWQDEHVRPVAVVLSLASAAVGVLLFRATRPATSLLAPR